MIKPDDLSNSGVGSLARLFEEELRKSEEEFPSDLRAELSMKHFVFIDGLSRFRVPLSFATA